MALAHRVRSTMSVISGGYRFSLAKGTTNYGQAVTSILDLRRLGLRILGLGPCVHKQRAYNYSPHSRAYQTHGGAKRAQPNRRGVTVVELAMTAPVLFLMLYAALELGHANMTFNTVEAACYEGARIGIVPGARADECQAAAERILAISKIRGATVTIAPTSLSTPSTSVQVRISLPYANTAVIPATFTRLLTINRQCELVREQP